MSFRCEVTGKQSRQGDPRTGEFYYVGEVKTEEGIRAPEKLHKIVVARRERIYTKWVKNEETLKYEEVFVAKGWEIVRELNATAEGVERWNAMTPEQRTLFLQEHPV